MKTSRIVLFGGSSVLTSYLPEEFKHRTVLESLLREAYPGQDLEVKNWADNGEFIARYLLKGVYEKHRAGQKGIDIAIIRFGTNDEKRMGVAEYRAHMLKFIALLKSDFPGLAIFMETGIYCDFPSHYDSDRNQILEPYWEVSREIAAEFGYPLVDYFAVTKQECEAGNWDIRARQGLLLDASQDGGKENDANWFSNIHPNPGGTRIAAREEARALKAVFPDRLPTGQIASTRAPYPDSHYVDYLDFPFDHLVFTKPTASKDGLQEAAR